MKILIVNSAKGGVGKTFITTGIARQLKGKVAVVDMDLTTPNIQETDDFDVISFVSQRIPTKATITRFINKTRNKAKKEQYDWLVIDTPPTISEIYLAISAKMKNAMFLFVSTGDENSINDTLAGINFFTIRDKIIIGVVQNMICKQIGGKFNSNERMGIDTIATFYLRTNYPTKKFEVLAKRISNIKSKDATIKGTRTKHFDSKAFTTEGLDKIADEDLKFINYSSWDEIRERLIKWETKPQMARCPDSAFRSPTENTPTVRSHYDVSENQIREVVECGNTCNIRIIKHLPVSGAPRIGCIIEVDIVYDNPISKGLPMFLTESGSYIWIDEVSIVSEGEIEKMLKEGGMEISATTILFNLVETLYLYRAFNRNIDLNIEYNLMKNWLNDVDLLYTKKDIGFTLYNLVEQPTLSYEEFTNENYIKVLQEEADERNDDSFLTHFNRCINLVEK